MKTLLRVIGAVETEQSLSFEDLRALSGQVADIAALIPGREGGGVHLAAILAAAGVRPGSTHITLSATDGRFSASVPLAAVSDAVVVYRIGDEPLPTSKGGPLRFLIPNIEQCAIGGVDACANVKYLGTMRVTIGNGVDTRPTTKSAHEELHRHEK